jgi:hypothetical protein
VIRGEFLTDHNEWRIQPVDQGSNVDLLQKTDCVCRALRSGSSIPDIDVGMLIVGNVATNSPIGAPATNSGHPSVCIKGQVKTDCRHTTIRSACSIPDTQDCGASVGILATTSSATEPASDHEQSVTTGRCSGTSHVQNWSHKIAVRAQGQERCGSLARCVKAENQFGIARHPISIEL